MLDSATMRLYMQCTARAEAATSSPGQITGNTIEGGGQMNTSAFDRLLFKERTLGSDVGGEFPSPPLIPTYV